MTYGFVNRFRRDGFGGLVVGLWVPPGSALAR
jgi:hypothetical protein